MYNQNKKSKKTENELVQAIEPCTIYASFDTQDTYNDNAFTSVVDSHPYSYNNNFHIKRTPYSRGTTFQLETSSTGKPECSLNPRQYTGIGNVDVESTVRYAEPSRTGSRRDLGGVSINRFDDLFVKIQENSVYPFDFPRGGIDSRDPQLYAGQNAKII